MSMGQDLMSSVVFNLSLLVIVQSKMVQQMATWHARQFQASMEYTHAMFVQRVPTPIISQDVEAPFLPI